jgi:hypothetical protein
MQRRRELGHIYPRIYTVGVDLGQSHDPTAIVVVETETTTRVERIEWSGERRCTPERVEHRVRYAQRLPLQMPYPDQVAYVRGVMMAPELPRKQTELVIDRTGVGAAVGDMFRSEGMDPIQVVITGGLEEVRDGRVYKVPKLLLVSRLQASLHAGELKFSPELAEADALRREFSEFRMRVTDAGRFTFGARENQHDDLILGLACAVWRAQARTRGPGISQARLLGI